HIHTPALLHTRSSQVFDWITCEKLKVRSGGIYPLAEAAQAHADMESRATTGKLLLIP
ncbi:MAG: quinone oxidoreductase, partial [Mesorhizobium sp.]